MDDKGRSLVGHLSLMPGVFLLLFAFVGHADAERGMKQVSLLPQWVPQAQFAGYMVAVKKGFYRDLGLDVELLRGGPAKDPLKDVQSGRVTFCTEWLSSAIRAHAEGNRLVNIAQIIQRSSLMLLGRKSAGIHSPQDLNGRLIAIWPGPFEIQPRAFFRRNGLHVRVIPNYTTVNLFLSRAVDVMAAMWYNEYHTVLNSGFNPDELTVFLFRKYGLDFPEDGLYCSEKTFQADPEMCGAFVEGSLRGWRYAFEHREEALDIVMEYARKAKTGTNRAHQRWMLNCMHEVILPQGAQESDMGLLHRDDFDLVVSVLKNAHLLEKPPDFERFSRSLK